MPWLSNLNSRFKIGTRIGAGYVLVLGLLVIVATTGYFGLRSASDSFESFARTSDNASRVAFVQVMPDQRKASAVAFLDAAVRLPEAAVRLSIVCKVLCSRSIYPKS